MLVATDGQANQRATVLVPLPRLAFVTPPRLC